MYKRVDPSSGPAFGPIEKEVSEWVNFGNCAKARGPHVNLMARGIARTDSTNGELREMLLLATEHAPFDELSLANSDGPSSPGQLSLRQFIAIGMRRLVRLLAKAKTPATFSVLRAPGVCYPRSAAVTQGGRYEIANYRSPAWGDSVKTVASTLKWV